MPEQFKALAIILFLATVTFAALRQPVCQTAIRSDDFSRRRHLWLGITLIAFLAHNFWICIISVGLLLYFTASREKNCPALYFFLLFVIPPISSAISGLGIVKHLFVIDYLRLLALAVLLPTAIRLRSGNVKGDERLAISDKILIAYFAFNFCLDLLSISFTGSLRNAFYAFTDMALPYYVVSRSLRSLADFRDALASFVVAGGVMAVIGMFEYGKHWLLYRSLDGALGVPWNYGGYLERGEELRAMATTGQPIVMGYVMAVAFGCFLFVQRSIASGIAVAMVFLLLVAGEVVPLSRGPWIGAAAIYVFYLATGPKAISRFGKHAAIGGGLLPVLYATPYWVKLIEYLPFVGHIDEGNVTYRERLLELCIDIILANPLFGSTDFLRYLEEMRQGQGIIDIVNTYLIIALTSGLVGLSLFLGFFLAIVAGIFTRMRAYPADSEFRQLGQALIAILLGALIMIFSVSPITFVPVIYWSAAGLGLAYIRLVNYVPLPCQST